MREHIDNLYPAFPRGHSKESSVKLSPCICYTWENKSPTNELHTEKLPVPCITYEKSFGHLDALHMPI